MDRSLKHLVLLVLVTLAGTCCLVGLGIGLWCVLDRTGPGDLLLRGSLALLGVVVLTALLGLVLGIVLARPVESVRQKLQAIRTGQTPPETEISGPAEWIAIADEVHQLSRHLEQERDRLEQDCDGRARKQRSDALSRFAEGIAREVQKPLFGVVGFAEMALRQPGVDDQLKNYLTLIDQEARSGREALERILRFGRDEPFPTEPLDVNQLLVRTSHDLVAPMEREKIRFKLNLSQDLPLVLGDSGQLMQVFATLIDNARDAVRSAGGTIEVSTNTDPGGHVMVMVKDTGRGISADLQERLFTPFFTTKGTRKGAGMNLAIAESIVRRHRGWIDFFSDPGAGAVFFVYLPPERAAESEAPG